MPSQKLMTRKIDCIERLLNINDSYQEITNWFVLNKFADQVVVNANVRPRERAEFIYKILKKLEADGQIVLLYFEWSLLPNETIKITCVTPEEEKLFTYGI